MMDRPVAVLMVRSVARPLTSVRRERTLASMASETERGVTAVQYSKLLRLLGDGVSVRAAAHATGISVSHAAELAKRPVRADGHYVTGAPGIPGVPFTGYQDEPAANQPKPNYNNDQPPPPPTELEFRGGYHDRSFKSFAAPAAFDGWDLDRVRSAVSLHRRGFFLESSILANAILSFVPVLAALQQRVAPALSLPHIVHAGTRGLSRILGREVERQLSPSLGLFPSPYFPPTIWGTMGIDIAMLGFSVLQHAYGKPDPETGVRSCYSRRWPTWAVQYWPFRKTFVALTTDGTVDIVSGDGKFTLIADAEEPHMLGAIVCLAEEALDGKSTQQARASYINRYGNPKWIATMPNGVAVGSPEGNRFFDAVATIRNPDGFGAIPFGATMDIRGLPSGQSTTFKDAIESNWQYVAAGLLGSDGTMTRGTGVYSAPIFAGVRRDLVARDLKAKVRGVNQGHVGPWLAFNYAASIAEARGWIDPVLDIPLPDPDADARIESLGKRTIVFLDIVEKKRQAGFEVTQDSVNQEAKSFDIEAPVLAATKAKVTLQLTPSDVAKIASVDEGRVSMGLEPYEDERGEKAIAEVGTSSGAPAKSDDGSDDGSEADDEGGDRGEQEPQEGEDESSAEGRENTEDRAKKMPPSTATTMQIDAFDESKVTRNKGKFAPKGGGAKGADKGKASAKKKAAPKKSAKKPAKKSAAKKPAKRASAKKPAKKASAKRTATKRSAAKKPAKKAASKAGKAKDSKAKEATKKKAAASRKKTKEAKKKKAEDEAKAEAERDKRHDPATYAKQYEHLGAAAEHAAHGHAMMERGLDMHPSAAADTLRHLGSGKYGNVAMDDAVYNLDVIAAKRPDIASIRELIRQDPNVENHFKAIGAMAAHAEEMKKVGRMQVAVSVSDNTAENPAALGMVRRASNFYATFAHKDHSIDAFIQYDPEHKRASYSPTKNRVMHSAREGNAAVLEHEFGHCLEDKNASVKKAALAFRDARTKGEETQRLKDINPKGKYKPDEICKPDKFIRAYAGRIYSDDGTEVMSIGCEYMAREPHNLYKHDPEMFHFILGALGKK
jgi:hypothetical protein